MMRTLLDWPGLTSSLLCKCVLRSALSNQDQEVRFTHLYYIHNMYTIHLYKQNMYIAYTTYTIHVIYRHTNLVP
jgi:hypothetical protein